MEPAVARVGSAGASVRPLVSGALLLGGGSALVFLTFMRYSLADVAWVAFAPFLVFLQERGTLRRHVALLAALVIAFLLTVSKMATEEIAWAPIPMFAIPLAVSYFAALAVAGAALRRLGARWGIYTFASMVVVMGWVQYTFTPGSSWGVLAHTQLDNLALVQLAALTGDGGITLGRRIGRRGDGGGGAERAGADAVRPDGRDRAARGARVLCSRSRPDHVRGAGAQAPAGGVASPA